LQVLAKVGGDLGDSCALWNGVLGVDVTIPKPRKQVGAGQVDYLVIRRTGRRTAVSDVHDTTVFNDDRGVGLWFRVYTVDYVAVG
jgi:hypothetical protein